MKNSWKIIGAVLIVLITLVPLFGIAMQNSRSSDQPLVPVAKAQGGTQIYLPMIQRYSPPPVIAITSPKDNQSVETTSNCIVTVSGTVKNGGTGWYIRIAVFTNQWYWQNPVVVAPATGSWQAKPVYLAGQGGFHNHRILAMLFDNTNVRVAEAEVAGVVRSNSCKTP